MAKKKKAAPRTGDLLSSVMAARVADMETAQTPTPTPTQASTPSRPAPDTSLTATEIATFGVPATMAAAPVAAATTAVTAAVTAATTTGTTPPPPPGSPIPGSTGLSVGSERTLAADTFVNTLALLIGTEEASKDYVKKLFALAAPYYRSGSTVDEAMNLALREAQQSNIIPEFTRRFRAIKSLEEMRRKGIPVEVPTIAEFIKSQEALGDVLRTAGLADLANEDFLNDVMSTGKSVRESTSIINNVFNAIDLAPEPVKAEIRRALPFADRNTLAKAILTGEKGLKELEQTRVRSEVQAAARQAGVSIADAAAQELANAGFTFRTSVPKFGQVKQATERGSFLTSLSGEGPVTEQQAVGAIFNQAADQLETLGKIEEKERLRFQGRTGAVKLASQARGRGGAF